jgi:hypothetical protein
MAATSVTTDLTTVAAADINNTDGGGTETWNQSTDGNFNDGGSPSDEPDFYIQGTTCVSASHTKNGVNTNTLLFDAGVTQTLPTDGAYLIWCFWASPPSLNTYAAATPGLLTAVGSGLGTIDFYAASGSDFTPNPLGGWYCYAVDPASHTADTTAGAGGGGGDGQVLGMAVTASRQARGQSFAVDAIRTGRGSSIVTGGTTPDAAATFQDIADTLDTGANRYGIFQNVPGGFSWQGRLALGNGTNEVRFVDSNQNITILNTPKVSTGYHQIEIQNGTSVASIIDWTNISFINSGVGDPTAATNSRGNFVATDNASITMDGCTFTDMGTFVFNGGTNLNAITGTTFRRCQAVTEAGASFTRCVFDNTDSTATESIILSSTSVANNLTNSEFIRDAGTVNAVFIDNITTNGTISWNGNTLTGYGTQTVGTGISSTAGGALRLRFTSGTPTITISVVNNATIPTVEIVNAGGTGTVNIEQNVSITITVKDVGGTGVQSAQVAVFNETTGATITNQFTDANGNFLSPVVTAANQPIVIRVRKSTTGSTRYIPVETTSNTGAAGVAVSVTLTEDELVEL